MPSWQVLRKNAISVYTNTPEAIGMGSHTECRPCYFYISWWPLCNLIRASCLSLTQSKLRLCSANHGVGYFNNLACDLLCIVWVYSAQETRKRALALFLSILAILFKYSMTRFDLQQRKKRYNMYHFHSTFVFCTYNIVKIVSQPCLPKHTAWIFQCNTRKSMLLLPIWRLNWLLIRMDCHWGTLMITLTSKRTTGYLAANYVKYTKRVGSKGLWFIENYIIEMNKYIFLKLVACDYKNIVKYTWHALASWPNTKQWLMTKTSDLMMTIKHILTIITIDLGKLKTQNLIHWTKNNWGDWLNLRYALDSIYLTIILGVQCL